MCLDTRGARNGLYLIQTAERRRTLAKLDRSFAGTYGETEANARLIAAAPRMFDALNRIAYKEFGAADATHRQVLGAITELAREVLGGIA